MLLIPAIDLKEGLCVRPSPVTSASSAAFTANPIEVALHWRDQGARRLQVLDLTGAHAAKPSKLSVMRELMQALGPDLPVQLGGGMRDLDQIERYLDMGVEYVIIGTAAVKTPGFLHDACDAFPGQIIVGLDTKAGKVATDGWSKITHHNVIDLAQRFEGYGVSALIYTDIDHDSRAAGLNIDATAALAQALTIPVFACGGLASLDDIHRLAAVAADGVAGAIAGRAIYDGTLAFSEAQQMADQLTAA